MIRLSIVSWVTLALLTSHGSAASPSAELDPKRSENSGKHLFILSGQSNMTAGLKAGFAQVVEADLGKENVTIVHQCKPGRGIRFWDKDSHYTTKFKRS